MNLFKTTFRKTAFVAALLSSFFAFDVLADGTRQVSPTNSVNGASLLSAPDVNIGPFRNASDNKRLRFTILNNASENLYFGFQPRTYDNNITTLKNNVYYRIFNAAGTQVAGPVLIPVAPGSGFISTYAQAFAGPNIGGATPTGYNPFVFDPTTNGDFYIELYASTNGGVTADVTSAGRVTFPFFDLTVSTTLNAQSIGRLWCKEWGMVTTNLVSTNFEQAHSSSFTGKFIALTPDNFKLQVNFANGFRPLGYQVAMNFEGPGSTGVWANDRKSRNSNVSVPTIVNGYKVFLTNPDSVAFPNGIVGNAAITKKIFGCSGNYYIPYYKDQPGDFALLLDLNGVAGYQEGTADILLQAFNQPAGNNVFLWNGLDGMNVQVPTSFVALVTAVLYQGRTNLPMIDAELNTNGLSVTGLFPATGNRRIYWDDSSITPFGTCLTQEENETTGGIERADLFDGVFGPTHAWDGSNPGLAVPAPSGSQGSFTIGALCDDYGNNRTINSWFYATDVVSNTLTLTLPTCDNDNDGITDNIDLDDDNDGIYDVVEYAGLPDPWGDADSDGIPNFLDPSTSGYVDLNFDGVDDRYDYDGDGIINQFDQDTDNDGIPDNIEAQTTLGYVGPAGVINNQGVYPNYFALGGLTPVNTDGTDNPDYIDLNSDNEGGNDTAEAGITLTGLDADNDGLDNATDATPTTGYGDVNGIYDNTQYDNFPDADADVFAGGDVDWRDAIFNDHDNDGVADLIDLDDDNDGILDSVESGGLPDALADADNDGILNYLDSSQPGFIDTNSDGVDDRYDFDLDGIINEFDLDSDNDGIFDVLEAGGVDSDANGTADDDDNNVNNTATNGIPTSAGAGTTPLDFGNNGTPNYLNLDSDEDGCFDVREAGFVDQNNDGKLGTTPTIVNANGRVTGTTATNGYTGTNANVTTAGVPGYITTQPAASTVIATGASGNISVVATGSGLVYQWQISTNGGSTWTNVSNGGTSPAFAGATLATLSLSNVPATSNGHRFRVLITSPTYVCTNLTSGSSILNVAASADLSITKTVTSAPVIIGGTVTYLITVTNNGPSTSTGFSVVDNLPAGLTYNSHTAPTNGTFNSGTMTWTATSTVLTSGQSTSLIIVCNVLANGGPYTNQAVVTGNVADPTPGNNTVNTPLSPSSSADVAVAKSVSNSSPQVGTNVTFTIVASNSGLSPANSVVVNDLLPAGYTFVSSSLPAQYNALTGVWTLPLPLGVGAGNNQTLTITATVNANQPPSAYPNTATISSSTPDPVSGNNSSTVNVTPTAVSDLQMTKTISPTNPAVGSTVTFTLKVKNNGLSNATGVQVVDNIAAANGFTFGTLTPPAGTTWNSGTNTWSIGNLNNGDSILWSFTATVNASGNYTNTATVSGNQLDNTPANNTSSATAGAVPQADLEITKTANTATPLVGGQITFTAKNNGPSTATSVNVFDNLPAGYANPVSVPAGAFVGNTWAVGNLASGASTSITVTVDVLATGPYNNTATISTTIQADPNLSNNSSTFNVTPIPVSNLSIVKTVSSTTPAVGSNVTFTITVTNNGPSPATNVQVIDTLSSGYTFVSFTAPSGQTYNIGGVNIWKFTGTPVTIASGASAAYTITATVRPSGIYTNCANVSGTELDQNLANNRSCAAAVTPVPQTDLSIVKTASNLTPNVGSNVTFTLVANNAGPSNASNVQVQDVIPSGYTFVGTNPAGIGVYTPGNSTYTWNIGTMNSGAGAQSVQILVSVNPNGVYQNCATIGGNQTDPNSANDISCVTPVPVAQANISLVKEAVPTTGNVGSPVSFVITVTNNGPSSASNVIISDTLPVGYTFVSAVPATYNQTTHQWPAIANMANGSVFNYIINATIAANGTPTTYTNTATALSSTLDPILANNSDTARVIVTQVANLAIAKSYSPANPTVGSQIVFTVTASNLGLSNATSVVVNDPLPSGYAMDSITTSQGTYTSPNWNVGSLLANGNAFMQVYAKVLATGNLTNTAVISGFEPDPNPANNSVSVTPSLTNVPPVANNDTTSTLEDNFVSINVVNPIPASASTDTDVDGTVNPASVDLQPGGAINANATTANGNWTVTSSGVVTFTPNLNFNGIDSVSYTVLDDDGAVSNIAWIFVNVIPVNDAPVANNDVYIINEDSTLVVNITSNDTDVDGTIDPTTVDLNPGLPGIQDTIITSAGIWTVNSVGVLTFVPVADTCGFTTSLPYTVNDNLGLISNIANIVVTIICVNDPPIAINDCDTTFEDTPITFNILANDYDIDSPLAPQTTDLDTLTPGVQTTFTDANGGFWSLDLLGNVTYTPFLNWVGTQTIYYTVCDTNLTISNVASIKIVVIPVNDPPVAVNDTTSTNEDTSVTFNVTSNDYDVDGNLNIATVVLDTVSNPPYGTWSVNNLGIVTYTPAPNFNGTTTITYTILDSTGAISNVATIVIIVNPINDTPIVDLDYAFTSINLCVSGDMLSTGDYDPDTTLLYVTTYSTPLLSGSTITIDSTGLFTYCPGLGVTGFDTILVTVCDSGFPLPAICVIDTLIIEISGNTPPIANNDSTSVFEDTPGGVTINVTNNDTDPNGVIVPSSVDFDTIQGNPNVLVNQYGTWTTGPLGTVTFIPLPNYCGLAYAQYWIYDNNNQISLNPALITINVLCVNDAPITTDVTVSTPINTPIGVNVGAGTSDLENNPLTYTYGVPVTSGSPAGTPTVTIDGNGAITVTPSNNFIGVITIPFTVCDLSPYNVTVLCDSGVITINVVDTSGNNYGPIANDDLITTPKDSSIVINPLGNDSDPDGDPLTVTILNGPFVAGALAGPVGPNGLIPYTPAPGFTGVDSIQYQICDNNVSPLCDLAWIYITVSPGFDSPNSAPIATNDYTTINEDSFVTYYVLINDTDPNGDSIFITPTIVSGPNNGIASINPLTGEITYTPNINFYGQDTVEYQICDNGVPSLCDNGLFVITVLPINDGPITTDITVYTSVNAPIGVNVGAGTSDPENNPLTYTYDFSQLPVTVTAAITGNGVIVVIPGPVGTYTIPFQVCDLSAFAPITLCDSGYITVIVVDTTGPNYAPVANDDHVNTPMDSSIVINPLANDYDPDLDPLTLTIVAGSPGTVNGGLVNYTPAVGYTGMDSIQYSICDPFGLCDTAWIYITVSPVVDTPNVVPIATDDFASTNEDVAVTIFVLNNDSDPNGNGLNNPAVIIPPSNGTAIPNSTGQIVYSPNPNFYGIDTFTYLVCDNGNPSLCDTALVTVTVNPVNDGPTANDIIVNMNVYSSLGVNVGAAVSDPENDPITYTYPGPNTPGITFVITGNGVITVTSGLPGTYIIPYTACDQSANAPTVLCDNGTITVIVIDTIGGGNHPPVANNDLVTTPMDSAVVVNPIANDFDVDGDTLTVTIVPGYPGTLGANGLVTYVPAPGFTGLDSIQYSICDPSGACDTAYIYITVSPVVNNPNVAPIATDDYATTDIFTPVTVAVLNNDSDPNGDSLSNPTIIAGPYVSGSLVVINPNGTITYTPDTTFVGIDSVQYLVCDNGNPVLCDTAWLFITVSPINNGPIATNIIVNMNENSNLGVNVGAAVSDPENNPLTYTYPGPNTPGITFVSTGNGAITVTSGVAGTYIIPYTVCDLSPYAPTVLCASGTITVIVIDTTGGLNNPPVANNDLVTVPINTPLVVINPIANDFDVDGDTLTVTIVPGFPGTVDPITGLITYIPTPGFVGVDSIQYSICDPFGACDSAYIIITVSPVVDTPNVAPIATDDYETTDIVTPVTVAVLNNDSDPNGNALNVPVVILTGPSTTGSTAFANPNGTITFTPGPLFISGTDSVEYIVCDNGTPSLCDTAWLFVTISPINDGPSTNDVWVITSTDIPIGVNVGAGTSDPQNNPLTYTYGTPSAPGTVVVINGNGTITVIPPSGFTNDTIIIPFTVCDSSAIAPVSICATGNIYVIVVDTTGGNNEAPIANDDLVTTPMNTAVTVNPLGNDTDANGGPLTVTLLPGGYPLNGGIPVLMPSGAVIYTPNPGFFGIDSIPYQVCDPLGLCDQAWIIITVSPVVDTPNVAPIATNDYAFIPEDSTITVAVLNNDSDPNGNNIGLPIIINGPFFGTAVVNPSDSTVTYTPGPNFYGTDTITYRICDDGIPVLCDIGQLIIVVYPVNDGPTTNDITVITQVDTPIGVNVGAGSSDPENNPLTFTFGIPSIPGVTIDSTGTGTINVTPPVGFVGTFTIPFQVCDSSQFLQYVICDSGYITVIVVDTVGAPNFAPIANNDLVGTPINTPVVVNPLGNDFDVNGDPLTVTLIPGSPVIGTGGGTATVGANGLVTYTPLPTFVGVDSIPYQICDPGGLCDQAWIIITISPVVDTSNVPPLATDDFVTTILGTPIIIAVLNNDSDPNGNSIGNPSVVILPGNGVALVNPNGTITYTPTPGFIGIDSFTYVICDNGIPVMCDSAVVYINVYSPNDPPSQGNETISTVKWCFDPYYTTIDVLANNIDPNGDSLIVTVSGTSTMGGTVTVNANGEIVYSPMQNYVGMDTVIYTVCDDFVPAACITDTIFITVLPDNDCDSIPDNIDIDDDNDGIQDIIECATANGACDTDGDGIPDYFDLDSDNDGIPDIVEAGGAQYDLNGDGVIDSQIDTDNDGLMDVADGNNGGTYLPNPDMDGDGRPNFQDLDSDNDGINDLIESGGIDVNGDGLIDNFNDADNNGIDDNDAIYTPINTDGDLNYDFLDLDSDNDGISDILESGQPDTDGDGMIDSPVDANNDGFADTQVGKFPQDFDNDSIEDYIDLDSDNDGIPDVRENGYVDNNQDGLVDNYTDANNNGWNDSSEGTTLVNSDTDSLPDYHDLDSDQDGIPDVVEGGQNDVDQNGLVDNYNDINDNGWSDDTEGDVISDVNTDGIPDYLDHDSDGDGCLDVAEGGFFDNDKDGVIDNFTDANNDGWDNLGYGWTVPDTDGDGIFDFRDLDSDNDDKLDQDECGLDCDNDGIPDNIDSDQCDDAVQIPNGFTPNGDGYNDFFVIEGIERFPNNSIQFFNRWGNVVFSTSDYQNDWAGKSTSQYNIGGEDLPTGTYYYLFDTGSEVYGVLSGYIYLQR